MDNKGTNPGQEQKCLKAQGIVLDTSHRAFIDATTLEKRDFILVRFPLQLPVLVTCEQSRMYSEGSFWSSRLSQPGEWYCYCAIDALSRLRC